MQPGENAFRWRLRKALPSRAEEISARLPEEFQELRRRETAAGIRPDEYFLLRPDGTADLDVSAFLHHHWFRNLRPTTRTSYAKDLRTHLSFVTSQGMDWRQVSSEQFVDYEYWRRRDANNPARISGAKFSRELAACRKFYEWQVARNVIPASPIKVLIEMDLDNRSFERVHLRPKNARRNRVKWLTPFAFRQWKEVGLAGYDLSGRRISGSRIRNEDRNKAFADLLWGSGLRLHEGATLLTIELPETAVQENFSRARLAEAVAKGRARDYWISRAARQGIEAYIMSTRAEMVTKARDAGRYENVHDMLILESVDQARRAKITDRAGIVRHLSLDELSDLERLRLYIRKPEGLEPAMIWLSETGRPLKYESWEMVFETASSRCIKQGAPISCTPHMLRHSFALRMLVTLIHATDSRLGITPQERREYRMLYGDSWVLVQTLLGHSGVEITKQVYLEPVQGLQIELFLNSAEGSEDTFLDKLAHEIEISPLINKGVEPHGSSYSSPAGT